MITNETPEPSLVTSLERQNEPRPLRPCERRPSPAMRRALRGALVLERGPQGEPWVAHPHRFVAPACARRGYASEYRVTPGGRVHYRITDEGRAAVAA